MDQKIYPSKRDADKWVNIDSSSMATGEILMNSLIQEAEMFYLKSGRDLASIFRKYGSREKAKNYFRKKIIHSIAADIFYILISYIITALMLESSRWIWPVYH